MEEHHKHKCGEKSGDRQNSSEEWLLGYVTISKLRKWAGSMKTHWRGKTWAGRRKPGVGVFSGKLSLESIWGRESSDVVTCWCNIHARSVGERTSDLCNGMTRSLESGHVTGVTVHVLGMKVGWEKCQNNSKGKTQVLRCLFRIFTKCRCLVMDQSDFSNRKRETKDEEQSRTIWRRWKSIGSCGGKTKLIEGKSTNS